MFRLHDEFVGIGYLSCLLNLLLGSIVDTEGDVVAEGVVEENGLLVHVTYQLAQVVDA